MTVTDIPRQNVSGSNRLIYQRLKQALSINLRRQIFIATCDDLWLRDCVAARLQAELTNGEKKRQTGGEFPATRQEFSISYPQFVSLALNISHPHPIAQIAQWLTDRPLPKSANHYKSPIGFQILGVEHLTRQSPALQWSFLNNLRDIEWSLPNLEFSLLLWVSRPWLCSIQQSAPEFWRCRTGVFEFEGEPTPTPREEDGKEKKDISVSPAIAQSGTAPLLMSPSLSNSRALLVEDNKSDREMNNGAKKLGVDGKAVHPVASLKNGARSPDRQGEGDNGVEKDRTPLQGSSGPLVRSNPALVASVIASSVPQEARRISNQSLPIQTLKFQTLKSGDLADLILATAAGELEEPRDGSGLHFWSLETLQYIELLQEQQGSPQKLAVAYQILGNFWRDRILAGEVSPSYLAIAICAYERALTWNSRGTGEESEASLQLWQEFQESLTQSSLSLSFILSPVEDLLNDLGTLYWMLSRDPSMNGEATRRLSYLERSIVLYQQAVAETEGKTQSQTGAILYKNLGAAYADLARCQNPAENWQRSAIAYQEALLHQGPNIEPQQYAASLNNLGTAYWHLAQYAQPVAHLKSAIAAYTTALLHYSPEEQALNYAGVQNNLGTAYWNLAQHEPSAELLSKAVDAYREALKYRTQERVPAACAATQNNLGTAIWHLAQQFSQQEAQTECLQQAIAAYEAALSLTQQLHPTQLSFDLFAVHNNLGLAHHQLATESHTTLNETTRTAHLEAALHHQLQACIGWSQASPRSKGENATGESSEAAKKSDCHETALSSIVKTIRSFYNEGGLQGQNLALSKVPGDLLPDVLRRL